MRWEGLFADLEAQSEVLAAAERDAEIDDRIRSETGRLGLSDRLRPAVGSTVRVAMHGQLTISGRLVQVRPQWLLVEEPSGWEALIQLAAVVSVAGVPRLSGSPETLSVVEARISFGLALRRIARDRSNVQLHLLHGGVLAGTLDRVGADFVELAVHPGSEPRRRPDVREVLVVPTSVLAAVRRSA